MRRNPYFRPGFFLGVVCAALFVGYGWQAIRGDVANLNLEWHGPKVRRIAVSAFTRCIHGSDSALTKDEIHAGHG